MHNLEHQLSYQHLSKLGSTGFAYMQSKDNATREGLPSLFSYSVFLVLEINLSLSHIYIYDTPDDRIA